MVHHGAATPVFRQRLIRAECAQDGKPIEINSGLKRQRHWYTRGTTV